ncbi:MAG: hypothetical protein ACYCY1_12065 [Sulfuriferula sp.]
MKQLVNDELNRKGKKRSKKLKALGGDKNQSSRFVETAKVSGVGEREGF